jgi:hypothetical protein
MGSRMKPEFYELQVFDIRDIQPIARRSAVFQQPYIAKADGQSGRRWCRIVGIPVIGQKFGGDTYDATINVRKRFLLYSFLSTM